MTPAEDFNSVIEYCYSGLETAANPDDRSQLKAEIKRSMETLEKIVTMQITMGGTQAHFRKAVGSIKVPPIDYMYSLE